MNLKQGTKISLFIFLLIVFFCFGALLGGKLNSQTNGPKWRSFIFNETSLFDKYLLHREISTTFKTTLLPTKCPNEYLGVVGFGQSNISNRVVREKGLIKPLDNVYMWDWTNGKCYPYSEPLVGTDGENRGNVITDMVINIRASSKEQPILIAPMAMGGSSVFMWYGGFQKYRLDEFLKKADEAELNFKYWIWIQGETDSIPELYLPNKILAFGSDRAEMNQTYKDALNFIFDRIKHFQPSAVFGVSLTTVCNNSGNNFIRKGQNEIINSREDSYLTLDTDNLDNTFRSDGCHFNEKGSQVIGMSLADFVISH